MKRIRLTSALLICTAAFLGPAALAEEETEGAKTISGGKFAVRMRAGKQLSGFISDDTNLKVLLAGKELKLPVATVESIQFDSSGNGRVNVKLINGDSLSASLVANQLKVLADWGTLKINSSALSQIRRIHLAAAPPEQVPARTVSSGSAP